MDPERWQQIDQLFHSALERDRGERTAFLAQACVGDERLRQEVESLLASHDRAASFIEVPAADAAAGLLAERHARLRSGTIVNRYKILDLLGEGGMGEVYLAQDMTLGRKVALKLLSTYLSSDGDRRRRFEQEARAASALSHANVCVVHEVGEAEGGRHYIVMEYLEGVTLRERMADARMKISEVLDTAVQVASALIAAHKAGIVHRDIKPENVILRPDGDLKVLDFGLAKLTERPAFTTDSEAATRAQVKTNPGMVMGTVQYMSPEQARGKDVDARTDIWSFGVVLYEMVTGRVPFEGETSSHVIVSLIESEPPPLTRYAEVPAELERIITKSLRKRKEERYQTASDLALDLKSLKQELEVDARLKRSFEPEASGRETTTKSDGQTVHAAAARTADVGTAHPTSSAEYLVSEIRRHKRAAVLVLATLVIAAATALVSLWAINKPKLPASDASLKTIAVLPFKPIVADNRDEALELGMADSLITRLSNIRQVIVRPTSAVRKYTGLEQDPVAAGRELNVDLVLDGSMQKAGERIAVRVRLVSVPDGKPLWAGQFDEKLADIFSVQDSISSKVAAALALTLSGKEEAQLTSHYTENSDAYRLYINGRYYWSERTEAGLKKGIEYFQQAINADPNYPLAYSGLADSYTTVGYLSYLAPKEAFPKAREAAEKAIKLDATLAEPHASLAYYKLYYDWNWEEAEKEFKLAIALNPNYATAHEWYGVYLTAMGRSDQALAELERAQELDPLSLTIGTDLGFELYYSQQYDQAIKQLTSTIEKNPEFPLAHLWLGRAYQQQGRYEEAIAEFKKTNSVLRDWPVTIAGIGNVYGVWGKKNEALQVLKELGRLAKEKYVTPYGIALVYAGLGDKDQAFKWLNEAYEQRAHWLVWLKLDPRWDNLRTDPRFAKLLQRMNLTP
jgi:eukaryotic-like serine/threonine-protein kinase